MAQVSRPATFFLKFLNSAKNRIVDLKLMSHILDLHPDDFFKENGLTCLGLLVGLVPPESELIDPDEFRSIMEMEYDANENVYVAKDLKNYSCIEYPVGYSPVTPVILLDGILPFLAASRADLRLVSWRLGNRVFGNISSVWAPSLPIVPVIGGGGCFLDRLFSDASKMALVMGKNVHIGASIGWDYEHGIGSLDKLPASALTTYGKILWQRTPEG